MGRERRGRGERPASLEHVRMVVNRGGAEGEVGIFFRAGRDPEQIGDPVTQSALPPLGRLQITSPEQVDDRHCQEGNAAYQ